MIRTLRPYSVTALVAVSAAAMVLAPRITYAAFGQPSPHDPGVHQGKIPVCSGLVQILEPTTGQPIVIALDLYTPCPGPPADIKVLTPVQSTNCGSSELLTLEVTDVDGYNVKDGTVLALNTTLGRVPETVTTRNGLASASFLAITEEQGRAEIVIRSGGATARKVIDVTCG
ncbi:MAG TPA: hypothetical protein VJB57_16985 [Dehalococcoidia bacterium]|nr:hypothetical protein [Dehalococcoidia bacterium]